MQPITVIRNFITIFLLLACLGCKHSTQVRSNDATKGLDSTSTKTNAEEQLSIDTLLKENFKQSKLPDVIGDTMGFQSGLWYLQNAVIAPGDPYSVSDPHNWQITVRRKGKLRMMFDIKPPVGRLYFYVTCSTENRSRRYKWGLFASQDKGASYKQLYVVSDTRRFLRKVIVGEIKQKTPWRFELRNLSNSNDSINFDDILVYSIR